jgi:hypothetical protein
MLTVLEKISDSTGFPGCNIAIGVTACGRARLFAGKSVSIGHAFEPLTRYAKGGEHPATALGSARPNSLGGRVPRAPVITLCRVDP